MSVQIHYEESGRSRLRPDLNSRAKSLLLNNVRWSVFVL